MKLENLPVRKMPRHHRGALFRLLRKYEQVRFSIFFHKYIPTFQIIYKIRIFKTRLSLVPIKVRSDEKYPVICLYQTVSEKS